MKGRLSRKRVWVGRISNTHTVRGSELLPVRMTVQRHDLAQDDRRADAMARLDDPALLIRVPAGPVHRRSDPPDAGAKSRSSLMQFHAVLARVDVNAQRRCRCSRETFGFIRVKRTVELLIRESGATDGYRNLILPFHLRCRQRLPG